MTRAQRRQAEREARKNKSPTPTDIEIKNTLQIIESVRMQKVAAEAAKYLDRSGTKIAAEQAYMDSLRLYDEQFSTAIVIACSMMLKEAFPRWQNKTIEKHVQRFMDYMGMYSDDYHCDVEKFKNLYAITFGEPLVMIHEDEIKKKPPVRKVKL